MPTEKTRICPFCEDEKHTVSILKEDTNCLGGSFFIDNTGHYHNHEKTINTISYECSNGHTWTETCTNSCWCGWTEGINSKNSVPSAILKDYQK